jgi:hypothetical protein
MRTGKRAIGMLLVVISVIMASVLYNYTACGRFLEQCSDLMPMPAVPIVIQREMSS